MNIDVNCDMGEIAEAVDGGSQEALMPYLNSVNIACGGHAGDERLMRKTVQQAQRWNLKIGAHPGYPDRANFGRVAMEMPLTAVAGFVFEQVRALAAIVDLHHVKPHGALYNAAVANPALSTAIAQGVARWSKHVVLVGLAGSTMLDAFRDQGFLVAAEAFADRRYEADGSLRPRRYADSLIVDPLEAARQVRSIVEEGAVTAIDGTCLPICAQTLCVHGDTPGALGILRELALL